MTIKREEYEKIINDLNVGNPVAEYDKFLDSARVVTPILTEVLKDKYDIVMGRKGAGKTAMFIIINLLSDFLLSKSNLVILSGVNSSGESIFNRYRKQFEEFSEQEFENFWKIYFIYLIYNQFLKNLKYEKKLLSCKTTI